MLPAERHSIPPVFRVVVVVCLIANSPPNIIRAVFVPAEIIKVKQNGQPVGIVHAVGVVKITIAVPLWALSQIEGRVDRRDKTQPGRSRWKQIPWQVLCR